MKTRKALIWLEDGDDEGQVVSCTDLAKFITFLSKEGYVIQGSKLVIDSMNGIGNYIAESVSEDSIFEDLEVCVLDHMEKGIQEFIAKLPNSTLVFDCAIFQDEDVMQVLMRLLCLDQDSIIEGTELSVREYLSSYGDYWRNFLNCAIRINAVQKKFAEEMIAYLPDFNEHRKMFLREPFRSHFLKVAESCESPFLSSLLANANNAPG